MQMYEYIFSIEFSDFIYFAIERPVLTIDIYTANFKYYEETNTEVASRCV